MAHLDDFVKEIIINGVKSKAHESEILELTDTIKAEKAAIKEKYTEIGEAYYNAHSDDAEELLAEQVQSIKDSEQKIKESKLKIGSVMGLTFCEACGEQVDEDDLYCNNCGAKMPVKVLPGMVLCPHCNKAVKEGIRFCSNCGKPMEEEEQKPRKVCPCCGYTTEDMDQIFCEKCNRRMEAEGVDPEEEAKPEEKVPVKKVCPNCGFKIFDAETMFCEKCNRRLVEEE